MRHSLLPLLPLMALGCARTGDGAVPTPTLLSPAGANHLLPTYSPDGSRVAGWQGAGDGFQLWLADADLGNLTPLPVRSPGAISLQWAPDGTQLATSRSDATSWSIVVVPAAGGDPRVVYSSTALMFPIDWTADGTAIIVLATDVDGGNFTTLVVDVLTGTARSLVPGEQRAHVASFAPVGRHAVVMTYDSARQVLWALDSIGAPLRQLTTEGFEALTNLLGNNWSPDGRELVYESTRAGAPDLYVLDFATGTSRQLTSDLRADRTAAWSPDGQWIVFQSERGRQTDLWVVPSAGGEAIRLTDDPAVEQVVGFVGSSRQVAYTIPGGSGTVHLTAVDGGPERQLTPDSVKVDYFTISPDGSQLAFTSIRTGSAMDIWVMPTTGGAGRLVATSLAEIPDVEWSPDGTRLLFIGVAGGTRDPWIVDVATGALRQVLTWESWENQAVWGADGTEVLVMSDRESPFFDVWRVPLDGGEPVRLTSEGRINGLYPLRSGGGRTLVSLLRGEGGRLLLGEVGADGTIRVIESARTIWSVAWDTPAGIDSVAVTVAGDGGVVSSAMMSLTTGETRPLGPPGTRTNIWARSGRYLAYTAGTPQGSAVGIIDPASGVTRLITPGDGVEGGAEFLPGDSVVVFRRSRPESRVAVLDLTDVLSRAP